MSKIHVVVADSQPDVRYALRVLLQLVPDLNAEVVGEVSDSESLIHQLDAHNPRLLLLDWHLPGLADYDLERLGSRYPAMKIIVLSGRPELRQEVLLAGADAFVSKIDSVQPLVAAIRTLRKSL